MQVGDLTDCGTTRAIQARAQIAQNNLIVNGIDFFPVRGNHETYGASYGESANADFSVTAMRHAFPQMLGTGVVSEARNFTPAARFGLLGADCLTYSFDYDNVRFIMLDTWVTGSRNVSAAGYNYGYTVDDQQDWLDQRLEKATRGTDHAFVITHQPLMAEDHQDTMFNGYTNANTDWQNAFYASMGNNNARYFISGHDHMHQRSIIASPDGNHQVEELICQSCSSKFYTPQSLTNGGWYGQKYRETSISQELYTVGFYIFTVDGPIVTVDFYSDDYGQWWSDASYPGGGAGSLITPNFNFVKKETWGYSLSPSGVASFAVLEGQNYTINTPRTVAKILKAGRAANDYTGRSFQKPAAAWWADKSTVTNANAISDVVTVLGAASAAIKENHDSNNNNPNDPIGIQLSFDSSISLSRSDLNQGRMISVNVRDENGNWENAVDVNYGGTKRFVYGPYNAAYPLGTYGIDNVNKVAWAVVNHDSDFAVIKTGN
jgi:3',5'-cyclic AMP phosphodiesterase CpdA